MKILYAIQATGNGHLSRAIELIPALQNRVQVDVLISGIQSDIELPFSVKYRYNGLSFIFGKHGGIDYYQTFVKNNFLKLSNEIKNCPVNEYDLIINDFEPVSAWAAKQKGVHCVSLSHQSALLSNKVPMPKRKDYIGKWILKNFAPAKQQFGFHFKEYDSEIYLPIIRKNIRQAIPEDKGHYTVYLPSYDDRILIKILSQIKEVQWHVFSKKAKKTYSEKNILVEPVNTESFEQSIISCKAVLCGAGFETPSEALFLGKKLMVIPMKGQYEQQINAASLKELGVPVLKKLNKKNICKIQKWVNEKERKSLHFPDLTQKIVDAVLSKYIIATEFSKEL